MLEGYTTLGYLAAHTSTVDLALLVTGVTYRHPGLLAKTVSTLDVLSGGRAVLGIGAAWYEREHRGLGVPFPPLAERFSRLEEALQIVGQMWDPEDNGPYDGRYYQLAETLNSPQPLHRPRILIGGGGEKKTLRLVAQYGDACNLFATSTDDIAHKLDVLRRHCDDVGRDFSDLRITITANNPRPQPGDSDAFVGAMADYAKLGVHQVMVTPTTGSPAAWIDGMAPAVRQLAELG
jgi:F420-dependent oxidoreductase-like protein